MEENNNITDLESAVNIETEDIEEILNNLRTESSNRSDPFEIQTGQEGIEKFDQAIHGTIEIVSPPNPVPELVSIGSLDENTESSTENYNISADSVNESENTETVDLTDHINPVLIDDTTSRFSGASWFNKISETNVMLAGIGGIGSWTALLLSRLHINYLTIVDGDKVESVNMSGQLFRCEDIDKFKVYATSSIIQSFTNFNKTIAIPRCITADSDYTDTIMICGFDNMAAREIYYKKWKQNCYLDSAARINGLFIDGRLNLEEFQIFCISSKDDYSMKRYEEKYLFSDKEVAPTMCSQKQTTYMASMIASMIVNLLVNYINNRDGDNIERELPFLTSYDAETMFLNVVK